MDRIKKVKVDENTRITVVYDTYPENPRNWTQEDISVYTLAQNSNFIETTPGTNSLETDLDTIVEYAENDRELYKAITKYFTRKNIPFIIVDKEQSETVWYIEPNMVKDFIHPTECLQACIDEYFTWAEGEVYELILETKKTWIDKDDPTNTMHTWEVKDVVSNIYADLFDDADVIKIAQEHFCI
jgi:phage anti-repressor protein